MSQPLPADIVSSGAPAGGPVAPRNWRVACQLVALVVIPVVLVVALTGLLVTGATRTADAYGKVGRLAALGQQVAGLTQAMAEERSGAAMFISGGRPAAGLPALHRQYAITDGWAARVRRLVSQLGQGYPAQTQAATAQALAGLAKLPGLRRQAEQSRAPALAVITGYSAAASGLLPVIDGIADLSSNPTLITSVRALSSLSRMLDHTSQQQAILDAALTGGRLGPAALTALTIAQAQQASDIVSFGNSATPQESQALTETLARPPARQAQAVEQQAHAAGNGALTLGPQSSQQWSAGMSYTVSWMGHAEQQLAEWITADAEAAQRGSAQSALVAGGGGLGALVLVLLGAMLAVRSMVRRVRLLEAAALEGSGARGPVSASAVSAGFLWRNHSLLEELLRLIDSMELTEDDPERLAGLFEMDHLVTRIWRNSDGALALAGHETPAPAEPLALVDVVRAAVSEIHEYARVTVDTQQGVSVRGNAATDTVHLLAELLENATTFSHETTQVIVSGHVVRGGGSLITITDSGPGMCEEELAHLNWQLANPSLPDMAAAPRLGLLTVAILAARHGIAVTLSAPPDGGTTAEVDLPAALILLDLEPGGWQGRAGEAHAAVASWEAGADVAELPFSAVRFFAGPLPPLESETDEPERIPVMLGAPLPSLAPEAPTSETEPEQVDEAPGDGSPIFDSVRSGYLDTFGRDLPRFSDQQAGQDPVGWPGRPPASWGEDSGGAAAEGEAWPASVAESAEAARSRLASFQRGSRRARTAVQRNRWARQPGQDD
ncbi:MAG TPA: nitrate- and nitrite sensing domain-containing protein [Streptosporangiaceae bacterium]|nr:nitrate- and nitrite sensing domain-containing protein [Streptosporangiaceae bacterium]